MSAKVLQRNRTNRVCMYMYMMYVCVCVSVCMICFNELAHMIMETSIPKSAATMGRLETWEEPIL